MHAVPSSVCGSLDGGRVLGAGCPAGRRAEAGSLPEEARLPGGPSSALPLGTVNEWTLLTWSEGPPGNPRRHWEGPPARRPQRARYSSDLNHMARGRKCA